MSVIHVTEALCPAVFTRNYLPPYFHSLRLCPNLYLFCFHGRESHNVFSTYCQKRDITYDEAEK